MHAAQLLPDNLTGNITEDLEHMNDNLAANEGAFETALTLYSGCQPSGWAGVIFSGGVSCSVPSAARCGIRPPANTISTWRWDNR